MSILFPSSIDTFTNPTPNSKRNNPSLAGEISDKNDAVIAIETKLGVDNSAVTTSIDYNLKSTSSIDPGHKHTPSVSLATTGTPSATTFLRGDNAWVTVVNKYGGNGADGALTLVSGTTTIDLGGATIVFKNYTSISITGTGQLAFTNANTNGTLIIIKSQGNVTLTSSTIPNIDASGMGGTGGPGGVSAGAGSTGSDGIGPGIYTTKGGVGSPGSSSPAAGGAAITTTYLLVSEIQSKYPMVFVGSGAGGGTSTSSAGAATPGIGGNGGGSLILECAGALNFTSTGGISVGGKNGTSGVAGTGNSIGTGGGGGGGGFFFGSYNTLTANSGTITVSGGTGGNNGVSGSPSSFSGGGGGGAVIAGSNSTASASNGVKTGGDGAVGKSLMISNTEYS